MKLRKELFEIDGEVSCSQPYGESHEQKKDLVFSRIGSTSPTNDVSFNRSPPLALQREGRPVEW